MDGSPPSAKDVFGEDSEDEAPVRSSPHAEATEEEETEMAGGRAVSEKDIFGSDDEEEREQMQEHEEGVAGGALVSAVPEAETRRAERRVADEEDSLQEDARDVFGEDGEDADAAPVKTKTHVRFSVPAIPPCADTKIVVRMPTFMSVQDKVFDEWSHDDKAEEELFKGASAIIRWRYVRDEHGEVKLDADGAPLRESNARLVKFTDGSMQLVVGDAVFDADLLPASNTYTYVQVKTVPDDDLSSPAPACFDCTGSVTSRMGLKPSSLTSAVHRRMVSFMASQTVRLNATKVRMDRHYNPERTKQSRLKEEEDRIKRERKLRAQGEGRTRFTRRGPAMSAAYLEEEVEDANYDSVDIGRMKRGSYRREHYSDDEEMADFIVNDDEEEEDEEEGDRWLGSKRGGKVSHRERELEVRE